MRFYGKLDMSDTALVARILEQNPDWTVTLDDDGRPVSIDSGLREVFGFDPIYLVTEKADGNPESGDDGA